MCIPAADISSVLEEVRGNAGKRRRDAIVMDAPIWYHTPKLILWCAFEALDLFLVIWVTRKIL